MNLYIEGAKVLNSVKQRRSAVKTLVYSSQYEVIIPLFIIVLKNGKAKGLDLEKAIATNISQVEVRLVFVSRTCSCSHVHDN